MDAIGPAEDLSPVLVVAGQSGRRWVDAARRFCGPIACAPPIGGRGRPAVTSLSAIRIEPMPIDQVADWLRAGEAVGILWEVDTSNIESVLQSTAQIAFGRPSLPHIAALAEDPVLRHPVCRLRLSELGMSLVVDTPEQFPAVLRLIRRRPRQPR